MYVCAKWLVESKSSGSFVGGVESADAVLEALRAVDESAILAGRDAEALRDTSEEVQRLIR